MFHEDRSTSSGLKVTRTINLLDSFGGRKVASLAKPYAVKSLRVIVTRSEVRAAGRGPTPLKGG